MPRLFGQQSTVWDTLDSRAQIRLATEIAILKLCGLRNDIRDGRRTPGMQARVTVKRPAEPPAEEALAASTGRGSSGSTKAPDIA